MVWIPHPPPQKDWVGAGPFVEQYNGGRERMLPWERARGAR
jgi:hypothetical protein